MPRIARQTILDRFQAMMARDQPIVGGGAGTGLSAKCEEAGQHGAAAGGNGTHRTDAQVQGDRPRLNKGSN